MFFKEEYKTPVDINKMRKEQEDNERKQRAENKEIERLVPEMIRRIAEFLSRDSLWSGHNKGKGFTYIEISDALRVKGSLSVNALWRAFDYFNHNIDNPEKVSFQGHGAYRLYYVDK